jgi:hypothetical protein
MYVAEKEEMCKNVKEALEKKFGTEDVNFKVKTVQKRIFGRIFIEIKGDETKTKPAITYVGNSILNAG